MVNSCYELSVLPSASCHERGGKIRINIFRFFPVAFAGSSLFFSAMSGRICKYWLPLLLWMSLIFSASTSLGAPDHTSLFFRPLMHWLFPHMAEDRLELIHHIARKTAHFVEYAMLGLLVWRAVDFDPAFGSFSAGLHFWFALLFCLLYASTDEFHQSFVPTRQPAVQDVLLDTCGSAFTLLIIWCIRKLRQRPEP
jgi:VanZ family protein